MKLVPGILIKNFPPKLRELALKRAFEMNGIERASALEKQVNACFSWFGSPEGHDFWSNVYNGKEFEWGEETSKEEKWNEEFPFPEKWCVAWEKKGDEKETNAHFNTSMIYTDKGKISYRGSWTYTNWTGMTQISMDQFRRYVVKKAPVKEEPKEKPYWAVRITPENREILGGWRTCGFLGGGGQGFCLCPDHPQGGGGTRGYHVNFLPEDCIEVSTEEFKKREGIVEAVKPQAATQTAYVNSPGVESSLSKYGGISVIDPYSNPCGEGVEKLPSAILIYRKEKVKRKLI